MVQAWLGRRLRFSGLRLLGTDPASDRAEMARIGGLMYLACAGIGYLAVLSPSNPTSDRLAIAAAATAALLVGLLLLAALDRVPAWAFPPFVAVSIVLVAVAIHFDGAGASPFAFFFIWATVYSWYYLPAPTAGALMACMGAAYAVPLALEGAPGAVQRWVFTMLTLLLLGLLIGALRKGLRSHWRELSHVARTDVLTGLPNRRAFEEAFDLELERARRGERYLSVVVCDLDYFKRVNDELGHAEGDRVLRETAAILRDGKRRVDTVARIGGEEFALTMPDSRSGDAFVAAERLRGAVARRFAVDRVPVTMSFGVATFPIHGAGEDGLLTSADRALYAAKELGRDRSVIYSTEVDEILRTAAASDADGVAPEVAFVVELAEMLDRRHATGRPSERVADYAEAIGRELGLPRTRAARLRIAGLLHDVGKIIVSEDAIARATPLLEGEMPELREHPRVGADLIRGRGLDDVREWILCHHERPDGRGFPRGLGAGEIPLEGHILAVADAYEAMTGDRVHRTAMSEEDARSVLADGAGTRWDERVVAALLAVLDRQRSALTGS